MPNIVLKYDTHRALKIALCLREVETLLELVVEDQLPEEARDRDWMGKRQDRLMWLIRDIESAVKAVTPERPPHQRAASSDRKTVWCEGGCQSALTLEQIRQSPFCRNCRRRAEADE
jgi:hypothetical protein